MALLPDVRSGPVARRFGVERRALDPRFGAGVSDATAKVHAVRGAILLALVAAVAAASATSAAASRPAAGGSGAVLTPLDALETELLALVNDARIKRGLRPLRTSRLLAAAADAHSRSLAVRGLFAHRLPGGPSVQRRVRRHYRRRGFRRWGVGENLVAMSPSLTAREAFAVWMASPTHRRNLLLPQWRELGLGAIYAQGAPGVWAGAAVAIVTADFGVRR